MESYEQFPRKIIEPSELERKLTKYNKGITNLKLQLKWYGDPNLQAELERKKGKKNALLAAHPNLPLEVSRRRAHQRYWDVQTGHRKPPSTLTAKEQKKQERLQEGKAKLKRRQSRFEEIMESDPADFPNFFKPTGRDAPRTGVTPNMGFPVYQFDWNASMAERSLDRYGNPRNWHEERREYQTLWQQNMLKWLDDNRSEARDYLRKKGDLTAYFEKWGGWDPNRFLLQPTLPWPKQRRRQ
jgi:hypothetical protein